MRKLLPLLLLLVSTALWAQAPKKAATPAAGRLAMTVQVTDPSGNPVPDVKVAVSGPVTRDGTTGKDGTVHFMTMRPGTYRLRFTGDGFITLERDEMLRAGPPSPIDVMLDPAPRPPAPPPAPPPPAPAVSGEPGAVTMLSLPDWIEKNFIPAREPSRDAIVGKAGSATAAVLQLRQPVNDQSHPSSDRIFYVIAGNGTVRVGGREEAVEPGWLTVVPHGTSYSIAPKGRNPLVLLAIAAPPSSNQ